MTDVDALSAKLALLRPRQIQRVSQLVDALIEGTKYTTNPVSDIISVDIAAEFGDQLRLHHNASSIPLTKDKFEYALISALKDSGHSAEKMKNGNPGADILVNGIPWSLKTQANRSIKADKLHIFKYMELGKGPWETVEDILRLRESMFNHMKNYERILSLKCLSRVTVADGSVVYGYELVEIPKNLLARAGLCPIEVRASSTQDPKPASCYVYSSNGQLDYELYLDGGSERKLQIKSLAKRNYVVHATWTFTANS